MSTLATIPEAIEELRAGRMLVVVDSPDRENQGDIIFPAETATVEKVNFLLNECRGLVCVALTKNEALRLALPLMVPPIDATEKTGVQFTVTVDAKDVTAFGISSADRAKTILTLASRESVATDLVRPGHVFPLLARDGGVLEREGHTESTVDLCRLAGMAPVGVLSEILLPNGEPARFDELVDFSTKHNFKIISVEDLREYLLKNPLPKLATQTVQKTAEATLPTTYGKFQIFVYRSCIDNREHIALRLGTPRTRALVRIHSECITGDALFSEKCDCGAQLAASMQMISERGEGMIVYLNQEGRGIGLTNKIKAYALQDTGLDTVEANSALGLPIDAREYIAAAEILRDQGIGSVQLITNNPAKVAGLENAGIVVSERVPIEIAPNPLSAKYLATKKDKLGHFLENLHDGR